MSTGFTPNELRFLIPPRSIADSIYTKSTITHASDLAQQMFDDLRNKRDEARDSIAIA